MHPEIRRNAKAKKPRVDDVRATTVNPHISEEELARLARDIAYFRAERFREVQFDAVREEDIRSAQAEIVALIRGVPPA